MPRGRTRRFGDIQPFGIDQVAAAAGDDPEVLRMENLDNANEPLDRLRGIGERVRAAL